MNKAEIELGAKALNFVSDLLDMISYDSDVIYDFDFEIACRLLYKHGLIGRNKTHWLFNKVKSDLAKEDINPEIEIIDDASWDLFICITSAYFGKQYYFVQSNGEIYSRKSEKYLKNKDEAIAEFIDYIWSEGEE